MAHRLAPLSPLQGAQHQASEPGTHAALSASAGTGKTHVLTARVLRLLLSGVDPASILCLTFTKAGAAEMAERIHQRLAHWVRLKDNALGLELVALGESPGPEMRERARTLFARVLDAAGGGLRIQTIHAFAQSLLGAFPAEAGLTPGFRPLEGREQQQLARQTLAEMLVRAEEGGDQPLIRDLQLLSYRLGEGDAEAFLMACARHEEAMDWLGPREGIEARLRTAFNLPLGDIEEAIAQECARTLDAGAVHRIATMNQAWGTRNGLARARLCEAWLTAGLEDRAPLIEDLHKVWARGDGEIRSFGKGQAPADPDYAELAAAAFECCRRLLGIRRMAALAAALAAGLRAGQAFVRAYASAKRTAGVADFDDLIRWAEALLSEPGMGDWVRFKLDQSTDHILVDEAQDTNRSQWSIIAALTEEFFSGEGAAARHRTIFTVGDFKQAIFRFQGTDPRQFEAARRYFEAKAEAFREAAEGAAVPDAELPPRFLDLSMDMSFRSSPPILTLVDRLIADIGHETLGLPRRPNPHDSRHHARCGSATLWLPYSGESAEVEDEAGEEGWISDTVRRYADRLARQIRGWLDEPFFVESRERVLRPEDILVLVRRRGTLAGLIVARLHAENVAVAGVDRLLLSAPLAVQDLLAAARFAAQPLDDLNLAALLVSPLFGWSQDALYAAARGRGEGRPLWPHLHRAGADAGTMAGLESILAMADYAAPHEFFETILSGPLGGRRKLIERLGAEARDPIEELLSSALEFETSGAPSLQRFLDWFARGDVEVVRDPSTPLDAVRVMTVHGAKGLQAPVVILADACIDPARMRGGFDAFEPAPNAPSVPIFRPRKAELAEPLKSQIEARDRLDREEHWRLLYVALTRAEERLFIGGALGPADRNGPPAASWHAALDHSFAAMGCEWTDDPRWGRSRNFGDGFRPARPAARAAASVSALPEWLGRQAPIEARPPRPLAPSAIGEDDVASPPPTPQMRASAERGRLLHQLFERLPDVAPADRAQLADHWLERSAGIADAQARRGMVQQVCVVIADPRHADIFSPLALAEAPIAAVIQDGTVITGTVDRLLLEPDRIRIVDFKTGARVPKSPGDVPAAHLRQMAAYVAALEVVFPGRSVEAALLYTATASLIPIDDGTIERYRPRLALEHG